MLIDLERRESLSLPNAHTYSGIIKLSDITLLTTRCGRRYVITDAECIRSSRIARDSVTAGMGHVSQRGRRGKKRGLARAGGN